jgi:DNA helicase-2/ATP-dependent DNA helicase PcrA
MTMHGSKGLSGKVVFIPGLEETIFPTRRMAGAPGLINEGARLLYVSITRGRSAVFCSFTQGRVHNGQFVQNPPSRYLAHLGTVVVQRTSGLNQVEAEAVAQTCLAL